LEEFLSGTLSRTRSWRGEAEKARLLERWVTAGSVLDVGCGDGKFLWALGPHWKRTGVDSSDETITLVSSRMPDLRLIQGDVFSESLTGENFDAITLWHVLEHLPDPRRVMRRVVSLLKPGGVLIISLPNLDSLQARLFRRYWYGFDDVPRHLFHYSKLSLDLLLLEVDLTIRRHLLFSRLVNFHALKHSLMHWSEEKFKSRIPYYILKPFLFAFPPLERITGKYGILTTIAQRIE
jgi:SAM-dependent methyltransferase